MTGGDVSEDVASCEDGVTARDDGVTGGDVSEDVASCEDGEPGRVWMARPEAPG